MHVEKPVTSSRSKDQSERADLIGAVFDFGMPTFFTLESFLDRVERRATMESKQ